MIYPKIHKDLGKLLVSSLILRTIIIHFLNNEFKVVYKQKSLIYKQSGKTNSQT